MLNTKFIPRLFTPGNMLLAFMFIAGIFWVLQCTFLQNVLGYDNLEVVVWGAQCAMGHAKHPPLSGWLGYAFSVFAGHKDWGLYLAAQAAIVCGVGFVYLTCRVFWDECRAATAAVLLYTLYYYNPSEMKFSTYYVEIALIPIATYFFVLSLKNNRIICWLAFGTVCGLAMLNKYSAALFFVAFAAVLICCPEYRKTWTNYKFYFAVVVGLLIFSPHFIWLVKNNFVCLNHVSSRLEDEWEWYLPFAAIGMTLWPIAIEALFMYVAYLISERRLIFPHKLPAFKIFDKHILKMALLLTFIPSCIILAFCLCGQDIILMWFCSMQPWTGVVIVACCGFCCNRKVFNCLLALIAGYTVIFWIGCFVSLYYDAAPKLHTDPKIVVSKAYEYWNSFRANEPIPVVVGGLWLGAVMENYSESRPPLCEIEDVVFWERYKDTINRRGALLIGSKLRDFEDFAKKNGVEKNDIVSKFKVKEVGYKYHSAGGDQGSSRFFLGYYPGKDNFAAQ